MLKYKVYYHTKKHIVRTNICVLEKEQNKPNYQPTLKEELFLLFIS